VATVVAISAFAVALIALWGVERGVVPPPRQAVSEQTAFRTALAQVWSESQSRRFAVFVLISMLAYSAQDLILEPYAGLVFGYTPGESTRLSGIQHAGVLTGMIVVALALSGIGERRAGSMRFWVVGGCLASAVALLGIVAAGFVGADWPLRESVFFLGLANGVFAVAAIGSMMGLADSGRKSREGVRMGIWGAAQAIAFGGGGFLGALSVDVLRQWTGTAFPAYAWVFAGEAVMFMAAAWLACGLAGRERNDSGAWLRNRSGEPASIGGG
jgi:BCD family chlorophyll transporter-like MFS transporter